MKQIYLGNEPLTAQEWLDKLERLRKVATPGPWKHDKWIIKSLEARKIAQTINLDNSAYIVAACNAVPMLIEMVQDMSSVIAGMPGMESTPDEILQDFFEATEPEE